MSLARALLPVALLAALIVVAGVPPAVAQELRIGLRGEPTSLDPQFHNAGPNNQVALHVFDALVARDDKQRPVPALAVSWQALGDTAWEFKLRPNVRFHDGSPFTAEDVVFTYGRAARVPNSRAPFTPITRQMTRLEIVDPLTLRIHTKDTAPLLPLELSNLPILSRTAAAGGAPEGRTTAELDRGEGLIGTGPFKFVEWRRGAELTLARNDVYWGGPSVWSKVMLRPLADGAARLAALKAGDLDLIEDPPAAELAKLRKEPKLALAEVVTSRLVYIALDHFAEPSPGIPDAAGKNPLKDKRVRQALALALDRKSILERVMPGTATPASDLLPSMAFGARKETPARFDAAAARALLLEAGFANGFSVTLGTANGHFANDFKLAQAIAELWSHAGIRTEVEAAAPPVFFKNRDEHKYSAYLAGWSSESGEMSHPLRALLATPNREKGMGNNNRGRYANPAMDAKLEEAMRTLDDNKREALLQEASALALSDYGLLPLHFELGVWAMRRGIGYAGRADQATLAQHVTLKAPVTR
jgi:peptide/nickel transport system substrate-binding protein